MANYDGLTRNTWTGTWSPSGDHPIALDTEIRGGLRYITGDSDDRLEDIPGQRLQEGMLVYLKNGYNDFGGDQYYKYTLHEGDERDTSTGDLPNDSDYWKPFLIGAEGLIAGSGIRLRESGDKTIISLTETAVQFGQYGSPNRIPVLVIDNQGRVVTASETQIQNSYKYNLSGNSYSLEHNGINNLINFYVLDPDGNVVDVDVNISDSDLTVESSITLNGHSLYVISN